MQLHVFECPQTTALSQVSHPMISGATLVELRASLEYAPPLVRSNFQKFHNPVSDNVLAGGNITVEMHAQKGDRSCANQAIGGNHYGPVLVYMSKVADSTKDVGSGEWFKVDEEGYNPTTKKWGTVSYTTKILSWPSSTPPLVSGANMLNAITTLGHLEQQLRPPKLQCSRNSSPWSLSRPSRSYCSARCIDCRWRSILHELLSSHHHRRWFSQSTWCIIPWRVQS
jgi:hypothetical protein